ncbi:MAG: hypothetical protein JNN28_17450 [Saprospiraceae bacterium]|nr:hypothetical protein [Saprospiraceae bacterium]
MKYLLTLGIVGAIIALIVFYPHTMISPGELSSGHQNLNHNCFACHAPFGGTPNDRCIACHKVAEIGKDTAVNGQGEAKKTQFHERLERQSCVACHSEHQGLDPESMALGFQHSMLPETVINNCIDCHAKPTDKLHQQVSVSCKSCHNTEGWKLSAKFDHNMLVAADKSNCAQCHEKPIDALHGSTKENCDKCHSTNQWKPATFDHDAYFVLDSEHNVACAICHKNNNYAQYTCYGCHEHTASNIRSEHIEEGIYNFNNCVSCHKSADEDDVKSEGRSGKHSREDNDDD